MLLVLIVLSINASSQSWYISPYASYSSKVDYYGSEIGLSWSKTWVSVDYSYAPTEKQSFVGVNLYNKFAKLQKSDYWLYNSLGYDFSARTYVYEPGLSVGYNVTKLLCPLFTVTQPVVKKTHLSYTLSLVLNL